MEYVCGSCKAVSAEVRDSSGSLRCVKCGFKIFFKARQPVARLVPAL